MDNQEATQISVSPDSTTRQWDDFSIVELEERLEMAPLGTSLAAASPQDSCCFYNDCCYKKKPN